MAAGTRATIASIRPSCWETVPPTERTASATATSAPGRPRTMTDVIGEAGTARRGVGAPVTAIANRAIAPTQVRRIPALLGCLVTRAVVSQGVSGRVI